jgi:hypothetical protein
MIPAILERRPSVMAHRMGRSIQGTQLPEEYQDLRPALLLIHTSNRNARSVRKTLRLLRICLRLLCAYLCATVRTTHYHETTHPSLPIPTHWVPMSWPRTPQCPSAPIAPVGPSLQLSTSTIPSTRATQASNPIQNSRITPLSVIADTQKSTVNTAIAAPHSQNTPAHPASTAQTRRTETNNIKDTVLTACACTAPNTTVRNAKIVTPEEKSLPTSAGAI